MKTNSILMNCFCACVRESERERGVRERRKESVKLSTIVPAITNIYYCLTNSKNVYSFIYDRHRKLYHRRWYIMNNRICLQHCVYYMEYRKLYSTVDTVWSIVCIKCFSVRAVYIVLFRVFCTTRMALDIYYVKHHMCCIDHCTVSSMLCYVRHCGHCIKYCMAYYGCKAPYCIEHCIELIRALCLPNTKSTVYSYVDVI